MYRVRFRKNYFSLAGSVRGIVAMGGIGVARRLCAAKTNGGRPLPGHRLGEYPHSPGQHRTPDFRAAVGAVDQGVAAVVLLKRQGYNSH